MSLLVIKRTARLAPQGWRAFSMQMNKGGKPKYNDLDRIGKEENMLAVSCNVCKEEMRMSCCKAHYDG
jgi:hypothetical protein